MRLLLFALFALLGTCGPPADPPLLALEAGPPDTYYLRTGTSQTLYFTLPLVNQTDSTQTLYCFAYASDNVAQPPARAVYPPRALSSMPGDRRFAVGNPALGLTLTLPPGDTVRFSGALPVPTEWPDGRAVASQTFRDLTFYAYNEAGRNVFSQTWPLLRLKGENSRPAG